MANEIEDIIVVGALAVGGYFLYEYFIKPSMTKGGGGGGGGGGYNSSPFDNPTNNIFNLKPGQSYITDQNGVMYPAGSGTSQLFNSPVTPPMTTSPGGPGFNGNVFTGPFGQ